MANEIQELEEWLGKASLSAVQYYVKGGHLDLFEVPYESNVFFEAFVESLQLFKCNAVKEPLAVLA